MFRSFIVSTSARTWYLLRADELVAVAVPFVVRTPAAAVAVPT